MPGASQRSHCLPLMTFNHPCAGWGFSNSNDPQNYLEGWVTAPGFLIQWVWGRAREFALLTCSQMLVPLLAQGPRQRFLFWCKAYTLHTFEGEKELRSTFYNACSWCHHFWAFSHILFSQLIFFFTPKKLGRGVHVLTFSLQPFVGCLVADLFICSF